MTTDAAGNALAFMGLQSTCRDLAQFGYLIAAPRRLGRQTDRLERLGHGGDRPVVHGNKRGLRISGWLNHEGILAQPLAASDISAVADPTTRQSRLVPGAPDDMFWAIGLGNQIVQIDPGSGTVVVRLGTPEARPEPPTFGAVEASQVVTDTLVD